MAKAKRIKADPVPTPPDQIQLTLSIEEARTLRVLTGIVSGRGENTATEYVDSIYYALGGAGVQAPPSYEVLHTKDSDAHGYGVVEFKNGSQDIIDGFGA